MTLYSVIYSKQRYIRSVRAALVSFLLVMYLSGISGVGQVFAYYSDSEDSAHNTFTTGLLDIALSLDAFEGVISNDDGDESQFDINVSLVDQSFPTQYTVTYEKTGGDDSLCDVLALDVTHGASLYNGALTSFSTGTTTDFGLWEFAASVLPDESVGGGETCAFDLIYKAWIDSVPTYEANGFSDEERFHIVIEAVAEGSPVVLNEFLPNPDGILCTDGSSDCEDGDPEFIFDLGKDSDDKPQGEWVELYNLTGNPVDLTGWYVQDASGGVGNTQITNANTLPATTTISAYGFLVVYMNKSVWNNTGDIVKLFNASDNLQDSYAYTSVYDYCFLTPTPGEINDEVPSGGGIDCTPGATIPANKSYARIPNGVGSWVDPIPTPGHSNDVTHEEIEQVYEELVVDTSQELATSTESVVFDEVSSITTEVASDSVATGSPDTHSVADEGQPADDQKPEDGVPSTDDTEGTLSHTVAINKLLYREEDDPNALPDGDGNGLSGLPDDEDGVTSDDVPVSVFEAEESIDVKIVPVESLVTDEVAVVDVQPIVESEPEPIPAPVAQESASTE